MSLDPISRNLLLFGGTFIAGSLLGKCGGTSAQLTQDKAALITAIVEKHDNPKIPRDLVGPLGIIEGVNPAERIIYVIENPSIRGTNIDRELLITALGAEGADFRDVEVPTPVEEIPVVH